jgi:hypothetical protein
MAIVQGWLTDLGFDSLSPDEAVIEWHISDNATTFDGRTIAQKVKTCKPNSSGIWSIDLAPTETMDQDRYYTIVVRWLGNFGFDELPWKIYVPAEGGQFSDLVGERSNPQIVWVGTSEPPHRTAFWFNPSTADFFRWE